jgi:hypothetical protein
MIDLDDDLEDLEYSPVPIEKIKLKLPSYTNEKLCEIIVCDRYFGCFKEMAVICMEELAVRRSNGNDFKFEDYIEKALSTLPKLNLNLPNLGDVLKQVSVKK